MKINVSSIFSFLNRTHLLIWVKIGGILKERRAECVKAVILREEKIPLGLTRSSVPNHCRFSLPSCPQDCRTRVPQLNKLLTLGNVNYYAGIGYAMMNRLSKTHLEIVDDKVDHNRVCLRK